jgi:glycosyltransferase involved in cell wall biosynthesis
MVQESVKPRLYYLGKPADGFGWGVCNTNLANALGEFCDVVVETSPRIVFDAPAFVPVDNELKPIRRVKAPRLLGYCFTEWPLPEDAERNARQYDVLFAGSNWNTAQLKAAGIKHAATLIQGVDLERFSPQPPSDRKGFVVFSGGKYEFRKGQDYVIAAMRRFMAVRSDVVLMTAWHNPWPHTMATMKNSWLINPENALDGLPMDRVVQLPAITNDKMAAIYAQAHIGVFPNRCEAGTNMVMCEFMACGRPVIASDAHGHNDVLGFGQYTLRNGSYDHAGWFNPNVSDIICHLEHAYSNRDKLAIKGRLARQAMEAFSWRVTALKVAQAAFPDHDFQ